MDKKDFKMNIELRFIQKAIEDRNCISFMYENKNYKKIKPLKLKLKENKYFLSTLNEVFEGEKIKNIQVLKERF